MLRVRDNLLLALPQINLRIVPEISPRPMSAPARPTSRTTVPDNRTISRDNPIVLLRRISLTIDRDNLLIVLRKRINRTIAPDSRTPRSQAIARRKRINQTIVRITIARRRIGRLPRSQTIGLTSRRIGPRQQNRTVLNRISQVTARRKPTVLKVGLPRRNRRIDLLRRSQTIGLPRRRIVRLPRNLTVLSRVSQAIGRPRRTDPTIGHPRLNRRIVHPPHSQTIGLPRRRIVRQRLNPTTARNRPGPKIIGPHPHRRGTSLLRGSRRLRPVSIRNNNTRPLPQPRGRRRHLNTSNRNRKHQKRRRSRNSRSHRESRSRQFASRSFSTLSFPQGAFFGPPRQ
jgi:hypothetical protein